MKEFKKHYFTICDLCKRCKGIDENDVYICKYNSNNTEIGNSDNPKDSRFQCKYFKRHGEYITKDFMSKKTSRKGNFVNGELQWTEIVTYKQGKWKLIKN